jgi:Rieske Fe-S protein
MSLVHNTADAPRAVAGAQHACGCGCAEASAPGVPRRTAVLAGAGLAAALVAGCSSNGASTSVAAAPDPAEAGDGAGSSAPAAGGSTGGAAGRALVRTAAVPVGGGVVVDGKYVVTQPRQGEFKAFSAICTHAGCVVNSVSSGTINCPCHGSRFSIADGSVAGGPAPSGLPAQTVTVSGDSVHLG